MKKVRCLIGVLGATAPALGVLAQAGTADAAPQAYAGHGAKTVSLLSTVASTPQVHRPCGGLEPRWAYKGTGANHLSGAVWISDQTLPCVDRTTADLNHSQTGLDMRTRIYNGTKQVYQGYVGGNISVIVSSTLFNSTKFVENATQACEALVYTTNKAKVAYGPVCENVPQPG